MEELFQIAGGISLCSKPQLFLRVSEFILKLLFVSIDVKYSLGIYYIRENASRPDRTEN